MPQTINLQSNYQRNLYASNTPTAFTNNVGAEGEHADIKQIALESVSINNIGFRSAKFQDEVNYLFQKYHNQPLYVSIGKVRTQLDVVNLNSIMLKAYKSLDEVLNDVFNAIIKPYTEPLPIPSTLMVPDKDLTPNFIFSIKKNYLEKKTTGKKPYTIWSAPDLDPQLPFYAVRIAEKSFTNYKPKFFVNGMNENVTARMVQYYKTDTLKDGLCCIPPIRNQGTADLSYWDKSRAFRILKFAPTPPPGSVMNISAEANSPVYSIHILNPEIYIFDLKGIGFTISYDAPKSPPAKINMYDTPEKDKPFQPALSADAPHYGGNYLQRCPLYGILHCYPSIIPLVGPFFIAIEISVDDVTETVKNNIISQLKNDLDLHVIQQTIYEFLQGSVAHWSDKATVYTDAIKLDLPELLTSIFAGSAAIKAYVKTQFEKSCLQSIPSIKYMGDIRATATASAPKYPALFTLDPLIMNTIKPPTDIRKVIEYKAKAVGNGYFLIMYDTDGTIGHTLGLRDLRKGSRIIPSYTQRTAAIYMRPISDDFLAYRTQFLQDHFFGDTNVYANLNVVGSFTTQYLFGQMGARCTRPSTKIKYATFTQDLFADDYESAGMPFIQPWKAPMMAMLSGGVVTKMDDHFYTASDVYAIGKNLNGWRGPFLIGRRAIKVGLIKKYFLQEIMTYIDTICDDQYPSAPVGPTIKKFKSATTAPIKPAIHMPMATLLDIEILGLALSNQSLPTLQACHMQIKHNLTGSFNFTYRASNYIYTDMNKLNQTLTTQISMIPKVELNTDTFTKISYRYLTEKEIHPKKLMLKSSSFTGLYTDNTPLFFTNKIRINKESIYIKQLYLYQVSITNLIKVPKSSYSPVLGLNIYNDVIELQTYAGEATQLQSTIYLSIYFDPISQKMHGLWQAKNPMYLEVNKECSQLETGITDLNNNKQDLLQYLSKSSETQITYLYL